MKYKNIKIEYLYRDQSNYKNYGSVILANPNELALEVILTSFKRHLIDNTFFYPEKLGLPTLFFKNTKPDDISWHELENIEQSKDNVTIQDKTVDVLFQ